LAGDHPAGISTDPTISIGPVIEESEASFHLDMLQDDWLVEPVAELRNSRFILRKKPRVEDPNIPAQFVTWDAITGKSLPAWQGEPGMQDVVVGTSNGWVATLRMTLDLPFADWKLLLRNLDSGAVIEVAESDPNVVNVQGIPMRLPWGLAPTAELSGNLLIYSALRVDENGVPERRIELFNVDSRQSSVLARVDPFDEDVWSPTVSGRIAAWVHAPSGAAQEIVLKTLGADILSTVSVGGNIYSASLVDNGRYLVWDDDYNAKYILTVASGEKRLFATNEGWGTITSGKYVSWTPSTAPGGYGGFLDVESNTLRFLPRLLEDHRTNIAQVMGNWFVWQDIHRSIAADKPGPADLNGSIYYFLDLSRFAN
jgi:hypothetical protein